VRLRRPIRPCRGLRPHNTELNPSPGQMATHGVHKHTRTRTIGLYFYSSFGYACSAHQRHIREGVGRCLRCVDVRVTLLPLSCKALV
jgi:hypothetical protein